MRGLFFLVAFDTLNGANRLNTADVPSTQAEVATEVCAEILEVNLKERTTERKKICVGKQGSLCKDMAVMKERIQAEHLALRKDTDARFARTGAQLTKLKAEKRFNIAFAG